MEKSYSYIATPPGATIKEQLADRGMSQKEFAFRMGMSEKHISNLINGKTELTPAVATKLELVLGLPARFWLKLEAIYRESLSKVKEENELENDIQIVKKLPYNDMAKYNWVSSTRDIKEKVISTRKFFEVSRLDLINKEELIKIACRRIQITEKSDLALLVLAQAAKIQARKIKTSTLKLKNLQSKLLEIRAMTTMDPEEFCPLLQHVLAQCGIALIFLPNVAGSFLHGATLADGNKIIIGITVRGKDADKFWFSLFHELGHVLYNHINLPNGTTKEDENMADDFAKKTLINQTEFNNFIVQNSFTEKSILEFANNIGIDKGIIVGRLQKEEYIPYSRFNHLKTKYEFENSTS